MKKLLLSTIILLFLTGICHATDLLWDAPDGTVTGYTVYYTDGTDTFNYNVTETSITDIESVLNLHPGTTYTFHVTAYNDSGESPPSNSLDYTTADSYIPPGDNIPIEITSPATITITIQ